LAGTEAHPVEGGGDVLVRPSSGHLSDDSLGLSWCSFSMLARSRLANADLGMLSTAPMDHEHDFGGGGVEVHDDLLYDRAHESLLDACIRRGRLPRRLQITGKPEELLAVRRGRWGGGRLVQSRLARAQPGHGCIPSPLQLSRHETIVWIDGFVPAPRQLDLVFGLLALELESAAAFVGLIVREVHGGYCGLDGERLDGTEHLRGDDIVRSRGAEGDTRRHTVHLMAHPTRVPRMSVAVPGVEHHEHASAASAAQEAREQRPASSAGLGRARGLSVGVAPQAFLGVLEVIPRDIACVVIAQQNGPRRHGPRVTVALREPSFDELRPAARFSVGVGARIEGILQHTDDVAVGRLDPANRPRAAFGVGRPREQHAFAAHVVVDLPSALEPREQAEDSANRILDPAVGVHLQAGVEGPEIADGHGNAKFPALGLGLSPFHQTTTHEGQLELAHRALEAEEQPVVRYARIVHPISIHDPGTNQTAELEEVVPVATIARKP
jgi:hypothetical protein